MNNHSTTLRSQNLQYEYQVCARIIVETGFHLTKVVPVQSNNSFLDQKSLRDFTGAILYSVDSSILQDWQTWHRRPQTLDECEQSSWSVSSTENYIFLRTCTRTTSSRSLSDHDTKLCSSLTCFDTHQTSQLLHLAHVYSNIQTCRKFILEALDQICSSKSTAAWKFQQMKIRSVRTISSPFPAPVVFSWTCKLVSVSR